MATESDSVNKLTRKDFVSAQDVRWCPGCGDYAVLSQVQKICAELGLPKENHVFVSGIGCSSRLPYYMNTYGFHGIHGRAPTIASGIKTHNPKLTVWVITGDGDALSIGGNHILHTLRKNINLKILLFNNRIYGLTKGQYSPTSEFGKRTKTSPDGTVDYAFNPASFAIGSSATFVARTFDSDTIHLSSIIRRAAEHKGSSFVEIYQNCVIFNDGAFKGVTDRQIRSDKIIVLEEGKPLIFGKERDHGIQLDGLQPKVVKLGKNVKESDLLVHSEKNPDPSYSFLISNMDLPEFPTPMGVFRAIEKPTYEDLLEEQIAKSKKNLGEGNLKKLLFSGETWRVS